MSPDIPPTVPSPIPGRGRLLAWGLLLLLLSRVAMVAVAELPPRTMDMDLYATLAGETRTALLTGRSFYEVHRAANRWGDPARNEVEYPPLAVAFVALPALVAPPPGSPPEAAEQDYAPYRVALRVLLGLADVAAFWILARAQLRHFPVAPRVHLLSFGLYALATGVHFSLLYDRLDGVVGLLLVAALAAMLDGRHRTAGALLALGTSFKLAPLLLVPLWVMADPALAPGAPAGRPRVAAVLRRLGWFALCMLLVNAPFLLREGAAAWGFLGYHGTRGLEVGSLYASILAVLRPLGLHLVAVFDHGSIELRGTGVGALGTAALLAQAAVTAGLYGLLLRRGGAGAARPAQVVPFAAALMVGAVAASKVLSPQYLLWLFPLLFLAPVEGSRARIAAAALLASLLTLALWPFLFKSEIVGAALEGTPGATTGPTLAGGILLMARNLLLVGIGVALARSIPAAPRADSPGVGAGMRIG